MIVRATGTIVKRMPVTTCDSTNLETEAKDAMVHAPASSGQRAIPIVVAGLAIVVDHFSKLLVETHLPLNHTWAPVPELSHIFRFTHVTNTGAAFGLFPSGSLVFTLVALLVAGVIVLYNFRLPPGQLLLRVALGLQLGGALGNLIDRLRLGHVTDFLDFGTWPVFNLADASIVAGVTLLAILTLREPQQTTAPEDDEDEEAEGTQTSLSTFPSQPQNEQAT